MSSVAGPSGRLPATVGVTVVGIGVLLAAILAGSKHASAVGGSVFLVAICIASYQALLRWQSLVALIVGIVLFVPIGFYRLPSSLPFNLDLYRIAVAFVGLLWLSALLIDRRVRLRKTSFDAPVLAIVGCVLASEVVNESRVYTDDANVIKSLVFFLGFVVVYYIVTSTISRRASIEGLLKFTVLGGVLIGAAAVLERRHGFNLFYHLHVVLPFLTFTGTKGYLTVGGRLRSYGSAQQPIALGAALVMLVPFSIYLARSFGRRWNVATLLLVLGALASGSRTAITMGVAEVVVYLIVKPRETRRLWPLVLPALLVVHIFLPGALGSLKEAFFPSGGIIKQQSYVGANYNTQLSGGRVRQVGPMLTEASHHWPFGEGYGTRITGFDVTNRNAPILDNQWLDNVLDIGYIGGLLWLWLICRALRRFLRAARMGRNDKDDWLFAAFTAVVTAFAVGMLTFDAFAFTQCVFLFWFLLALGACALAGEGGLRRSSSRLSGRPSLAAQTSARR